MKNRKDISLLKAVRIAGSLVCYKHFVPIGTDKKGCIKGHFFTAKFAKKSQRSQRDNHLFIKMLPILYSVCFICCYVVCLPLLQPQDVILKLAESNPCLLNTGPDSVGEMELLPVPWAHLRYLFPWDGSPEAYSIRVWTASYNPLSG